MELARGFSAIPGVRVKTLCDPDSNLFAERVRALAKQEGGPPGVETDLRRVFDDDEIDAVAIATPDHWHALATIWACQAGKHVYVEKPCSHNLFEGRRMVEAARKYGCIVEVGFQNRSIRNVRRAMKFLHDGGIGEVYLARGLCFKPRDSIGRKPDSAVPDGVDYDLWLGCAPERPFNENRFHYEWHWFWDYGCGDIGNQGPHQFDIARWGLGVAGHPVSVQSEGGYFAWDSDQETPNTQTAAFRYADGRLLTFEVRGLYTNAEEGIRIGNLFYGTEGWMHLRGSTWKTFFGRRNEPGPGSEDEEESADPMDLAGTGSGNHFENFVAALRSGRAEDLTCGIEEGFLSTALPHLANIAYRVGRRLRFDGARERFAGDREADALRTRPYREPFVVPEEV
jgi:predicted dehydrogenase